MMTPTPPRGRAGDSGAARILAEAGRFAPRGTGPLARDAAELDITFTFRPPGGCLHRMLCALGAHARVRKERHVGDRLIQSWTSCAVCGRGL